VGPLRPKALRRNVFSKRPIETKVVLVCGALRTRGCEGTEIARISRFSSDSVN
jgi:hypothetical protein